MQALLLTKHVLFLGVNMQSDDKIHAIFDSVQRARTSSADHGAADGRRGGGGGGGGAGGDAVFSEELNGTLLQRLPHHLAHHLWKNVNIVTLTPFNRTHCGGGGGGGGGVFSERLGSNREEERVLKQQASRTLVYKERERETKRERRREVEREGEGGGERERARGRICLILHLYYELYPH